MLLTLTTTHQPATELGYLLAKHPERVQSFPLPFGHAHVAYPEAGERRCTAALLLDVDPVGLVRGPGARRFDYVNDRPYVASSLFSVALAKVFRSALAGTCRERPELAATPLPLVARLPTVAAGGQPELLHRLFAPLGYRVTVGRHPLDDTVPDWGDSPWVSITLEATIRLSHLLGHLYVLLPVLDDDKHYYVSADEIDKLLRHGADWLPEHPERDLIVNRYLRRRGLAAEALERLLGDEPGADDERADAEEGAVEERVRLADARTGAVLSVLRSAGARRVLDVGCGEGRLLRALLSDPAFTTVAGMDVSARALAVAARRLRLDRLPPAQRDRVTLFQGALTYADDRLAGYDAVTAVEVVEHLDPDRLDAFAAAVFGRAKPATVLLTTPNVEYNPRFEGLPAGRLRHRDHRFEWSRAQFRGWGETVAERHGYALRVLPVGEEDPEVGPPTQMAVFSR